MNERPLMNPAEPERPGTWLDAYMPERQVAMRPANPQLLDPDMVRGVLWRQRWLIVGVILAALTIGVVLTLIATPMYQANAKVSVKPYGQFVLQGQSNQGIPFNTTSEYVATQLEVLKSRQLALVVADNLNLAERYDVLGKKVQDSRAPGMSDKDWTESKRQMAATLLTENVVVKHATGSFVIEIGFKSENPVIAAEIANAYTEAFISSETRSSLEKNQYALDYLKREIEQTRSRLQLAEVQANDYARSRSIIVQPVGGSQDENVSAGATLTGTKLASINEEFIRARAERIAAEQRWRALQNLPAAQIPEVLASGSLQDLVGDLTAKRAELADLRQRYNDDFPQIRNLLAQINTINAQLERSSADIKTSLRNELNVARNKEQALQQELDSLTQQTLGEQDQKVELSVLDREAQALRDQLELLLSRYNEVNSAANVNPGTLQRLDAALVPEVPYSPNILRNLSLALALGIAFAAGLAVLRETFDDRIRTFDDVEEKVGLPFLGYTPFVAERDISIEGSNRFSTLMEAYSSVRSAIDFSLPRSHNLLQLTSTQPGEGKSTTAVILAEMFASVGRKTLLVDADLRRPSVAKLLELERPKLGTVEVVLGHASLGAAVVRGTHDNLDILPMAEIPPNPAEIFASPEFQHFLARCRSEYSLVIFDSCPVLGIADAPMLAAMVDATVFVLEANVVPFSRARAAIRRLNVGGGKVIGAVLTKYRALEAGQSYNYQYSYYQYGGQD